MTSVFLDSNQYRPVKPETNIVGSQVKSVTWRIDNQPSVAEIEIPRKRFHEFRKYNAGKKVWVKIRKNLNSKIIFNGYITGRAFDFSQRSESVSIVCQDARWHMTGDFVKGRYMLKANSVYDVLSGLKCVFNERLENSLIAPGNGEIARISNGVRPFSLKPRSATDCRTYSVNDMLWYVYYIGRNWHTPAVVDDVLTMSQFGIGELGSLTPYDVNVDGLSITEAMDLIFKRAGLRWWTKPVSQTQSEVKAFIAGASADTPRKYLNLASVSAGVSPYAAPTLPSFDNSQNNIEAGRMNEDFAEVANEIYAFGDRKIYQDYFTFKPGWNSETWDALKTQSIATIRKELRRDTSSDWTLYGEIGRKWVLDEDGAISGTSYDFATLFGSSNYAQTARVFQGENPDGIEFACPNVKHPVSSEYVPTDLDVRFLSNQAGIYLEGDELAPPIMVEQDDSPPALLASEIKMELAVKEDKALEKTASESGSAAQNGWMVGIIESSTSVDRRLAILTENEYQQDNQNAEKASEVAEKLQDVVDRKLSELKNPKFSASFSIPWISTAYELGDIIAGIKGRNLYFTAQIVEIRFDFDSQRTELVLEDLRQAES